MNNSNSRWTWETWIPGWRRAMFKTPGYDCRVECKHEHKGDHGVCSDAWFYVVSDGESAVSLRVRSTDYPETVRPGEFAHLWPRGPEGTDLTLHVPWLACSSSDFDDFDELVRKGDEGSACEFTENGRCWMPRSASLGAREFFAAFGEPQFVQPATFWTALRLKAAEWIADEKRDRDARKHLRQCPTCRGRGVVEDKESKA